MLHRVRLHRRAWPSPATSSSPPAPIPDLARGTLRFSLGHTSTEADVEAVAKVIGPVVERARAAGLA